MYVLNIVVIWALLKEYSYLYTFLLLSLYILYIIEKLFHSLIKNSVDRLMAE